MTSLQISLTPTYNRDSIIAAVAKLQQEGSLTTKAHYATALKEVSNGLNSATGYNPSALVNPGKGILSGIDIDKIFTFVKLFCRLR